ncbi:MAG TPA: hypothetical protein PLV21_06285 [Cyclobacteriaceae bacterium]|nr:hypothetical protein [Cyclobacteriaceae bacterium]HRJ81469.1 hypothetical protein [Cyclobacteriaceae bacterium]
MKKGFTLSLFLLLTLYAYSQNRFWVASSPGNWNNPANWSTASGGAGGASVPIAGNTAIFNNLGVGTCILDISPNLSAVTINATFTGTIDLPANRTLTTTGTNTFAGGIVNSGTGATLTLNSSGTTTFSGTQFDVPVDGSTAGLNFNGSIFNGAVNLTKTDNVTYSGLGGNTFNNTLTVTTLGGGELRFALTNPDTFSDIVLNINGTGSISMARNAAGTLFNGNITVNYNATGNALFGNAGGTSTLAATRIISVTCGASGCRNLSLAGFTQAGATPQSLTLSGNPNATLTLGPNSTFNGPLTFTSEEIVFNSSAFNAPCVFSQTGTNSIASRGGNTFQSVTFNNVGPGDIHLGTNAADAGDIFNGDVVFNNTGGGRIRIGSNTAGNIFHGNLTLNNTSVVDVQSRIQISRFTGASTTINGTTTVNNFGNASDIQISFEAGSLTTFNGNVIINNAPTAPGDFFWGNDGDVVMNGDLVISNAVTNNNLQFSTGTGTVTFGNGTISIGAGGFNIGQLRFRNFTQTGATPVNLTLTGTATQLQVGPATTFGGNVDMRSPRLFLSGVTVAGNAYFEKTGATEDTGAGNNIFNGTTTIVNSANGNLRTQGNNTFNSTTTLINSGTAYLLLELSSGSTYNGNVTLTNTSTSNIRVAYAGATVFNGNVTFNNPSGTGIIFCETAGATATLSDTYAMNIGGLGFSVGSLNLNRFTQIGSTAQALTLTGTAVLNLGPTAQFDGAVNFVSPQVLLNGTIFNGTTYIEKSGATGNTGAGNSTFNGTTTIVNNGSGFFRTNGNNTFNGITTFTNNSSFDILFENVSGSTYNNDVTFNNLGSSSIRTAWTGNSTFNGNIIVNNLVGTGVLFCETTGGSATLANTKTIAVGGSGFNVGNLFLARFTQIGATPQALGLTGNALLTLGPSSSFGGNVNFVAPQLLLNGTTYSGTAYLEKTSVTGNDGAGGNVFNNDATIVNSGDAYLATANTNPDIFNGTLRIINSGASTIRLANNSAGNQFNGNIELNSTFGGGIWFGNGASASATLAATRTIGVGSLGVISGDVRLIRFTQVGPTPQTLDLTGIAILTLGPSSSFGGNIDFRAPQLFLNGVTVDGTAYLEKKGAGNNSGTGGNIFNGITTLVNSGSGFLNSADVSPDIFNTHLTITNTGSSTISIARSTAGNQFNGNITFNSTLGSGGIYISSQVGAASTMAAGGSLLVGGSGFSSGFLSLRRFTQLGAEPQTLVLTGTALLELGPSSTFNGNVDFRSSQFLLNGATFNGITYLEKTGATDNTSNGGNIFNGVTTIANSGSGFFRFANTALDQFNNNLTLTNTGAGTIRMADNFPGTVFNGNIVVNSTFGGGIYFSESGGGTATLAAGRTISVGGSGFTTGDLRLRRFTQSGGTPQTLLLTGVSRLLLGPSLIFNGNVDLRAPQLFLQGGTYNGTAYVEKTGATGNASAGGNTFNGVTTLANSGSGEIQTGATNPDIFNAALTVTNTGTNWIRLAENTAGNEFNGNVTFNNSTGLGIIIGQSAGGFATLASGRTLNIGSFTAGELRLFRLTQAGPTAQSLTLTGTSLLRIGGNTTFNGAVNFVSPQVLLEGSIYNGTASIEKNGATTNNSNGGNTFNGTTTITNSSTAQMLLSNGAGDTFNGPVTFVKTSSGALFPAYNLTNFFASNVTVNSNSVLTFAGGTGVVEFTGSNAQTINKTGGTPTPILRRITLNKAANQVTLNTDVNISITATFLSGIVNTDAVNFLNFGDNATATGANNASYIDGPVRKTGDDPFIFPVGDNGFYRPISISAPTTTTHAFTAQYFNQNHLLGSPAVWDPSFFTVSGCEYWTLDRNVGASNVFVTLSWNEAACNPGYITNPATLRVTRWTGTNWVNQGNGGTTGTATNGTIITSAAVTAFSPFTLASTNAENPLPVELVYFRANLTPEKLVNLEWQTASELNNDGFEVERSKDGFDFTSIARINGAGTTSTKNDYALLDQFPLSGTSYYRLKQIDFDGTYTYSYVVSVKRGDDPFTVYPNPAGKQWVSFNRKVNAVVINNLNQVVGNYNEADGFETSDLAPGLYIIRTQAGEIFKLIVQ